MRKFFFILFFFCLFPALAFTADIKIEGKIFTDTGFLKGAKVYLYKSYDDIDSGRIFSTSEPTNEKGLFKLQVPPGEYFFIARGKKDGKDFFVYHGDNPIKVTENIWLILMANEAKSPEYSEGSTSLKGVVTYKGQIVKDAYISLYTPETKKFKGLGFRTESVNSDGTFDLSIPAGKYVVIGKKMEGGKRIRPLKKGDLYCYYPYNPVEVKSNKAVTIEVPCYPKEDRFSFIENPPKKPRDYPTLKQELSVKPTSGIKGRVTDVDGNPVDNLFVLAYKSEAPVFLMYHVSHGTEYVGETDKDGNYFIPIDTSGDYHVIARGTLGGSPKKEDFYGIYEGNPKYIVSFEKGQVVDNINIIVGKTMTENVRDMTKDVKEIDNIVYPVDSMIDTDTVWKGNVIINGKVSVKRGVTLTIEPGTIVKFNKLDRDNNGVGDGEIMVEGRIIARGTSQDRIIFTSDEKMPKAKDWSYVLLLATGEDNIFEYCEFQYAFSGLQVHYSNAKVTDCLFDKNYEGIRFSRTNIFMQYNSFLNNNIGLRYTMLGGKVIIENNLVSNNNVGVLFRQQHVNSVDFDEMPKAAEQPIFRSNNIFKNREYNLKFGDGQSMDIDVTNNWWGEKQKERIENFIFDKKRDSSLGQAIYLPYLTEPVKDAGIRDEITTSEYIQIFEDPRRAEWQKPEKTVDYLTIKNGDIVADIGAGSGYFTVIFSKKVGDKGKVYAVDIEKGMIDYIKKRAKKEDLKNIKTILSTPDDPLLPKYSVDLIFMCNTYMYIENREAYLKILKEALKKNGRLAIVDFHATNTAVGPPPNMRISEKKTMEEVLKAGFKLKAEYNFLPYQYFLIFTKK
jgi:ubiquinone/menaquinone biosynthesis C-methylase UbiE